MNNFLKYISVIYFVLSTSAYAAWPDKTLKIVVPYGPGGGVDTFARPLTVKMGEQLGNPFVVDNKAGAGGTIGVLFAAKSAPDGYTFLAGAVHQTMSESLYPKRGYDFDKDPIVSILSDQNCLGKSVSEHHIQEPNSKYESCTAQSSNQ